MANSAVLCGRCKFIEESGGCKDLCLNVCKAGTEEYMKEDLQFPVRLLAKTLHPDILKFHEFHV